MPFEIRFGGGSKDEGGGRDVKRIGRPYSSTVRLR